MEMFRTPDSDLLLAPTVLIVDDNADLGVMYSTALRLAGIAVEVAHNAEAAWTAATALNPDVILLDIYLGDSDGDGLDLLDRLREHDWRVRAPRIVVFTNADIAAYRSRAASAGADDYLVKVDLRLRDLPGVIRGLAGQATAGDGDGDGALEVRG